MKLPGISTQLIFTMLLVPLASLSARSERFFNKQFEASEINIISDLSYGEKVNQAGVLTPLLVDLFLPPDAKEQEQEKLPLIMVIHGGGFRNGNKEQFQDWAIEYATFGYAAACINYRLTPEEMRDKSPGNFITAATHATEDGMDAIRFLKQNASTYGFNPERIATIGMSAGGWISALNAIDYDHFNGAKNFYPGTSSKVQAAIATGVSFADNATCKIFRDSLMHFDKEDTPMLLFHAEDNDRVTSAPWSEAVYLNKRKHSF
jgi:acetyl esterase/lipase